ncbi:hypothetical protein CYMTET_24480 [Cymbomonas tetramitiformis]|uniref:RanBP2-type domain-containing protein n=1 Tax=Cymbomonas tetramitiformis TaxID=36881 RepID=A0AAE0FWI0_9CHLO|nr:hypothetical protein CYMTET_24480 [Cymbomonas tetramitiformis]
MKGGDGRVRLVRAGKEQKPKAASLRQGCLCCAHGSEIFAYVNPVRVVGKGRAKWQDEENSDTEWADEFSDSDSDYSSGEEERYGQMGQSGRRVIQMRGGNRESGARDSWRDGGDRGTRSREAKEPSDMRPGDWMCNDCGSHNFSRNNECFRCRFPRPDGRVRVQPRRSSRDSYDDEPRRGYGGRSSRDSYDDEPRRGYGGRSSRDSYDDEPRRGYGGRSSRDSYDDEPRRGYGGRSSRDSYDDEPKRGYGGRDSYDDEPRRGYGGRSSRDSYDDEPRRGYGGRSSRDSYGEYDDESGYGGRGGDDWFSAEQERFYGGQRETARDDEAPMRRAEPRGEREEGQVGRMRAAMGRDGPKRQAFDRKSSPRREERGREVRGRGYNDRDEAKPELMPGDWLCGDCGAHNFRSKKVCFRCRAKPAGSAQNGGADSRQRIGEKEGDWSCKKCGEHNFKRNKECFRCSTPMTGGARFNERRGKW